MTLRGAPAGRRRRAVAGADVTDWYDGHAEQYDRLEQGLEGDIAFYTALARAASPPALELGCGTGRVALALARAGVAVVGLDRSSAMLAVAQRKSAGVPNVRWANADMRTFALPQRFGCICIPHRSFQLLLADDDQRAALARARDHLLPGGTLALNIFNPLPAPSRNPQGTAVGRPYRNLRVRLIPVREMRALLDGAGFEVDALYGWFDRRPFTPGSREQVWVARAPA